jgi:hypothetical protein
MGVLWFKILALQMTGFRSIWCQNDLVQGADLKLKDQITPHVKPSDCYAEKVVK